MPAVATLSLFSLFVIWLLAIGLVSWRRTRSLRHGRTSPAQGPPRRLSSRSSRSTFLAFLAGMAAVAWAVPPVGAGDVSPAVVATGVVGLFIAATGWTARVTEVRAEDDGVLVRFARRRAFTATWEEVRTVEPPAWPIGGWRLSTSRGSRSTLMPSDLYGHEDVLAIMVCRAQLRFDGRIWRRQEP